MMLTSDVTLQQTKWAFIFIHFDGSVILVGTISSILFFYQPLFTSVIKQWKFLVMKAQFTVHSEGIF